MINIILTSVQNTENFLIYASITRKQNFLPMQFYLHREEIQFSSRGNFNGIGMDFYRHREGEKPNFLSVCYRKKKIKSRV